MSQQIIIGNASQALASSTKGWVVGHFMPKGLGQSADLEIKLWHYDQSPEYGVKEFGGTEFIIVEKGVLVLSIQQGLDSKKKPLFKTVRLCGATRDYVVLPPNCKKQVMVGEAPAYGVTVRWPSAPGINVVVK